MYKLGLIINPVAGMGGRVGLKGTDGPETLRRAIEMGAKPAAHLRAAETLDRLKLLAKEIILLTPPGRMGGDIALERGFATELIGEKGKEETSAEDTRTAAVEMLELGAELLLFAGGDGTARDVYAAIGRRMPALGIPAGVKIHSAAFAVSPASAGELTIIFFRGPSSRVFDAEVMDINEEEYRAGILSARLYGYLKVPQDRRLLQGRKSSSPASDYYHHEAIAQDVIESMEKDVLYIIGPGTTTGAILDKLGLEGALLGIDAVCGGKTVGRDLGETQLLELLQGRESRLIITPIGGQGYLLGRGNQQLSPEVIRRIGKKNIIVVATSQKLNSLMGRPLLIDSGDRAADEELSDYYQVITGYHERAVYRAVSM